MRWITVSREKKQVARAMDASNFFLRLRGLLGRKISPGEGLLLSPCNQIHTFGMAYPIDVVYIAKDGRILHIEHSAGQGKAFPGVKGAKKVLELSKDFTLTLGLKEGELLEFQR